MISKIKVVNLFRLAKRLEPGTSPSELYCQFEKSLYESWELLTKTQKEELDEVHASLRMKYQNRSVTEKEALFGTKPGEMSDFDQLSRVELEKQILELVKNMKNVAGNFSSAIKQDDSLLGSISTQQSKYLTQIKQEHKKIDKIQVKTSYWATIKSLFAVLFSLVVFICMMIIIYLFPSTTYISLKA